MLRLVEPYITYGYAGPGICAQASYLFAPNLVSFFGLTRLFSKRVWLCECSYPNLKSVKEMVYKRGFGKVNRQRVALSDNAIIEQSLGAIGLACVEDLIHEIFTYVVVCDRVECHCIGF